jgi:hypothetical protein
MHLGEGSPIKHMFYYSTTYYGPGDQRRWDIGGCCRPIQARGFASTATDGINQSRCCLGRPTQSTIRPRRGVCECAYAERGANPITPANATWIDSYNDWKNGAANVNTDIR